MTPDSCTVCVRPFDLLIVHYNINRSEVDVQENQDFYAVGCPEATYSQKSGGNEYSERKDGVHSD